MRDRSRAFPNVRVMTIGLAGLAFAVSLCVRVGASVELPAAPVGVAQSPSAGAVPPAANHRRTLDRYCVTCHNEKLKTAGLMLDVADVANYRNMVVKIRDRIREMSASGMTLEQIKAAKPTLDYDGRYGSPDRFIEAVFRTLDAKK